jgi:phosphoglycolate phosphatase
MGLALGVATNDSEAPARAHLAHAGIADLFAFVAGYDSGWGGKPAPGQLLAFARAAGLDPGACAMVGDSLHDLAAARAAGMAGVAVLTGIAGRDTLAPAADAVLGSVAELPDWIAARG